VDSVYAYGRSRLYVYQSIIYEDGLVRGDLQLVQRQPIDGWIRLHHPN